MANVLILKDKDGFEHTYPLSGIDSVYLGDMNRGKVVNKITIYENIIDSLVYSFEKKTGEKVLWLHGHHKHNTNIDKLTKYIEEILKTKSNFYYGCVIGVEHDDIVKVDVFTKSTNFKYYVSDYFMPLLKIKYGCDDLNTKSEIIEYYYDSNK